MTLDLWPTLASAINPTDSRAMPLVLKSTIDLLESELVKARTALQEIQPNHAPRMMLGEDVTVAAMAAYRKNLINCAPDFNYGATRLTPKDLGFVREMPSSSSHHRHHLHHHHHHHHHSRRPEKQLHVSFTLSPPSPSPSPPKPTNLLDILSNTLVLDQMAPYLPISSLLALAASSKSLRSIVMDTPYVFRRLDLTRCRGAQLPTAASGDPGGQSPSNQNLDDYLTEDEVYSAPVRSVFDRLEKKSVLQDVRTLILDGLSVPADLVADIILTDRFRVSILSIRDCLHLNERKLMQVVQHAVRPTRPKGFPRVKGIYYFTSSSNEPGDDWYKPSGKIFKRSIENGWAQTLRKCQGIISFDAALCQGARHDIDSFLPDNANAAQPEGKFLEPAVATVALGPNDCGSCHGAPANSAIWGKSAHEHFPLLTPPPLHSSTVTAAKRPSLHSNDQPALVVRCTDCIADRWCHRCNKWFCFSCLPHPEGARASLSPHQTATRARNDDQHDHELHKNLGPGVSKDCWECGPTCASCKVDCQRVCRRCRGEYCIEHNDGCSATMCDWCNTTPRRLLRD